MAESKDSTQGRPSLQPLVGKRVRLAGGYDMVPSWLGGRDFVEGVLQRFIPGQNSQPAALVRLDAPLTCDGCTGSLVVLELRHVSAFWTDNETVHVELCDFEVPALAWKQRQQGKWVESHANFKIL